MRISDGRRPDAGRQPFTEAEIASQPACWRRAAAAGRGRGGTAAGSGERVAVVGLRHVLVHRAVLRGGAGGGRARRDRRVRRLGDAARPATTTACCCCPGPAPPPRSWSCWPGCAVPVPTVAITADARTPVAGPPTPSSTWASPTRSPWCRPGSPPPNWPCCARTWATTSAPAARAAERVLAEPLPAELLAARQFTFLGTGWTYGLANEAALKLREAAGMWTESYPAMEYRHGPVAVTGDGSVVWVLGPAPDGLADDVAAAGGIAWSTGEDPLAELVRVHRVAVALARAARARPGPAAEPDPFGHPGRPLSSMILVVCLNPALDITHHVAARGLGGGEPAQRRARPPGRQGPQRRPHAARAGRRGPGDRAGRRGHRGRGGAGAGRAGCARAIRPGSAARPGARSPWSTGRPAARLFNEPGPPVSAAEFAEFRVPYRGGPGRRARRSCCPAACRPGCRPGPTPG